MTELDGGQFCFGDVLTTLVTEASQVQFRRCERIFDDACDVGIRIRGRKETVDWACSKIDEEGEEEGRGVLAWHFIPASEQDKRKANGVTKVTIFND